MQARRSYLQFTLSMITAAALATLVACAAGAEGTGGDDDPIDAARIDAPNNPNADARIDAPSSPIDARIDAPSTPIDAPIGLPDGGTTGACTTHAECGAGNCCFGMLMCVPGDPLPLPPPFDCLPA